MEIFVFSLLKATFSERINIRSRPRSPGKACVSLMECIPIVSINVPSVVYRRASTLSRCIVTRNHNSNVSDAQVRDIVPFRTPARCTDL